MTEDRATSTLLWRVYHCDDCGANAQLPFSEDEQVPDEPPAVHLGSPRSSPVSEEYIHCPKCESPMREHPFPKPTDVYATHYGLDPKVFPATRCSKCRRDIIGGEYREYDQEDGMPVCRICLGTVTVVTAEESRDAEILKCLQRAGNIYLDITKTGRYWGDSEPLCVTLLAVALYAFENLD